MCIPTIMILLATVNLECIGRRLKFVRQPTEVLVTSGINARTGPADVPFPSPLSECHPALFSSQKIVNQVVR